MNTRLTVVGQVGRKDNDGMINTKLFTLSKANGARLTTLVLLMSVIVTGYGGLCGGGSSGSSGTPEPQPAPAPSLPAQVTSPTPGNGATGVSNTTSLVSWSTANGATSYDVYWGTSYPPVYQTNTANTMYNPGVLSYNTTYYWRIDSKNSAGTTTGVIWSFATQSAALPIQVTTPDPVNSATDVSIAKQLGWAAASSATSYDVYLGITATGWTAVTNTFLTSFSPSVLEYATQYYWRIDSKNSAGTTTGVVWSFTTQSAPVTPPAQVTFPTPANSATNLITTTQLSWVASTGATSYDVYFGATSPGTFIGNQAGITYNPGVLSYNTVYYWRVDPKNAGGTTTGVAWNFTTSAPATPPPQATSPNPANAATNVSIITQTSWAAAISADSYDVYFGTTATPTYITNTTLASYNPGTLNYSTTYYWRINPKNSAGTTTGALWSFTTQVSPLSPPAQTATPDPANAASGVVVNKQLGWSVVSDASSYDVYFGTTSPGTFIGNQTGTTYNPGALSYNTTYYWRIDSKNSAGTTQGVVWSFTTQIAPPAQVTSPTPANSATNVIITTQLSWAASTGAGSYDIYFGATSPGTLIGNQAGTTYNPGTLSYNTIYYWRIDPKNTTGTTQGIVLGFTTQVAPAAQVTSPDPVDNAVNVITTTQFSWASAGGATSYDVCFGTSNPPTLDTNTALTTYNPGDLNYSTLYYWRIDSKNAAGVVTTGQVWSFTTQAMPLADQATSPSPADAIGDVITSTQLSWGAADRAASYDIYLGISDPPAYQANTSGTTYNPGGLPYNTLHYWRIDSKNAAGVATIGVVWSFTTSPAPPQVTTPNPADAATNVVTTTQISWAAAISATSYDVYFATTTTGWSSTNTALTTYDPGALSYGTTYYWRIDSKNAAGAITTGQVWSFTTELSAPTGVSAIAGAAQVTLSWNSVSSATSYNIYWSTSSGVTKTTGTQISNVTSPYDHTSRTNGTIYYYVVTAVNSDGESNESAEASATPVLNPTVIGSCSASGYTDGVYISGSYAYIADSSSGLQIIDCSDPGNLTLRGSYDTPGDADNVYVVGSYAYVADRASGLQIIDCSDPYFPVLAGSYATSGDAMSVYVSGSYAYVACSLSGLQIINISNPAIPTLAGSYDTPGYASGVYVAGSYAYVADYDAGGLQIINITNPAIPTLVGSYDTPGEADSVYVAGNYAYVADRASGLQIINITNPAVPTLAGSYNTPGTAYDVYAAGPYVYVADYDAGLQIIDCSAPATPTLVGSYDTAGYAWGVYVAGAYAYVADGGSGLQTLSGILPLNPTLTGSCDTPGGALGVYISGNYAYVADQSSGLQIIDCSAPATPTLAGFYDTPGAAYSVYVSGNYAYVADYDVGGLQIINITNPAVPTLAGSYDTSNNSLGVYVAGSYAYVADGGSGLQIINISNPVIPTLVGSYDTPGSAYSVYVVGSYAYVADEFSGLQIINITNPAIPTLAGSYNTPGGAYSVYISGNYAYIADYGSLQVINITDPANPTLAGSVDTGDATLGVYVVGSYAYVTDTVLGLQIIDCSNPARPFLAGYYNTPGETRGVYVVGSYAYVGDGSYGLKLIKIGE